MKITEFTNYTNYISKYDLANVFDVNIDKYGNAVYNLNESLVLPPHTIPDKMFKKYKPKDGETPLLISYNVYSTINLYWLILKLNNISDSFYKFSSTDSVSYLDLDVVKKIIENM